MCGEDGADLRDPLFEAQQTRPRHPLVELGDGVPPLGTDDDIVDRLDHLAGRIAEHDRLHVIPSPGDGVDAVVLPDLEKELVLVVLFAEADENRLGPAGDLPAAEPAGDLLDGHPFPHIVPARLVRLLEIGVGLEVRAEGEVPLAEGLCRFRQFAGNDGVDPADLVADLPTHLKQVVSLCFLHVCAPSHILRIGKNHRGCSCN